MTGLRFRHYSLKELNDALKNIDRERYPDDYNAIIKEIARKAKVNPALAATISDACTPGSVIVEIRRENLTAMPFQFTGRASEYFRIWIVNLFLSILTLGIYSAWSKVRTKQYFYANTHLNGSSFRYLGDPVKILKGRLLIAIAFVAYVLVDFLGIELQFGALLVLLLIWPFVVILALRFVAVNSAYRNIRFGFEARARECMKVYWAGWILVLLTAGLALPWFFWKRHQFRVNHSRYGRSTFRFNSNNSAGYIGSFVWSMFFSMLVWAFLVYSVQLLDFFLLDLRQPASYLAASPDLHKSIDISINLVVWLAFYGCAKAELTNLLFNNATIGEYTFVSTQKPIRLFSIYLTNIAGIVVSAGLLTPWAKVRLARYRAENLSLLAGRDLSEFIAAENSNVTAIGDEIGELVDLDIGF